MSQVIAHQCKFCDKLFKTEYLLKKHACKKKTIVDETSDLRLARAYTWFSYWFTYNGFSKKAKSYSEATRSPYFKQFIELDQLSSKVYLGEMTDYIAWLSDNRIPTKNWTTDIIINQFKADWMKNAPISRAVKTAEFAVNWCDRNKTTIDKFWFAVGPGEFCSMIEQGRFSPWVLYTSKNTDPLFLRMNDDHLNILVRVADPEKWTTLIKNMDSSQLEEIVKEVGL